jgi:hypothetical protein
MKMTIEMRGNKRTIKRIFDNLIEAVGFYGVFVN